ncbi:acid phosphatase [Yoonia maritima]|uniref:acid phosphatase n=1 Tax=Yoonia maritima TaxID=1435347 RepID=UPI000D0EB7DE|nr:phosphatase PAP2 family protein [Yoonia maritima]
MPAQKPSVIKLTLTSTMAALFTTTAMADPQPVGAEFIAPLPDVAYPLPVVKNYIHQTGQTADGAEINKYDRTHNPIIAILSGFDAIWTVGLDDWHSGGATGSGNKDYSQVQIIDADTWAANVAYVVDVTDNLGTHAALRAYLDDRRHKGVSVLDGFGPLEAAYVANARAGSTIDLNTDTNIVLEGKIDDHGRGPGLTSAPLGTFVEFMSAMRGPEGTTSPSKYFYSSPRPWRMNDAGEVVEIGTDMVRSQEINAYDTNVNVIPALLNAREIRGRHKDAGYPSGHTNAGYISAITYAYAAPQRYSEMLTRASELGESRITAGMHSPLDVIGGRIMSTAVMAAYLNDPRYANLKVAAYDNMQSVMGEQLQDGESLMDLAQSGLNDAWPDDETNKALYQFRMTYGLPQDTSQAGQDMIVPQGAEALLETRLPYLSDEQRRAVLYTTGIDSGWAVLDASNGWGRLNLVAAADGYGKFLGDVTVDMDIAKGTFNAADDWGNDISGPGMLTKRGSGELRLSGENSFMGGITLENGTLTAASATAFGTGDVLVTGGMINISVPDFAHAGEINVKAGNLYYSFDEAPEAGAQITILKADTLNGEFDEIIIEGANGFIEMVDNAIIFTAS